MRERGVSVSHDDPRRWLLHWYLLPQNRDKLATIERRERKAVACGAALCMFGRSDRVAHLAHTLLFPSSMYECMVLFNPTAHPMNSHTTTVIRDVLSDVWPPREVYFKVLDRYNEQTRAVVHEALRVADLDEVATGILSAANAGSGREEDDDNELGVRVEERKQDKPRRRLASSSSSSHSKKHKEPRLRHRSGTYPCLIHTYLSYQLNRLLELVRCLEHCMASENDRPMLPEGSETALYQLYRCVDACLISVHSIHQVIEPSFEAETPDVFRRHLRKRLRWWIENAPDAAHTPCFESCDLTPAERMFRKLPLALGQSLVPHELHAVERKGEVAPEQWLLNQVMEQIDADITRNAQSVPSSSSPPSLYLNSELESTIERIALGGRAPQHVSERKNQSAAQQKQQQYQQQQQELAPVFGSGCPWKVSDPVSRLMCLGWPGLLDPSVSCKSLHKFLSEQMKAAFLCTDTYQFHNKSEVIADVHGVVAYHESLGWTEETSRRLQHWIEEERKRYDDRVLNVRKKDVDKETAQIKHKGRDFIYSQLKVYGIMPIQFSPKCNADKLPHPLRHLDAVRETLVPTSSASSSSSSGEVPKPAESKQEDPDSASVDQLANNDTVLGGCSLYAESANWDALANNGRKRPKRSSCRYTIVHTGRYALAVLIEMWCISRLSMYQSRSKEKMMPCRDLQMRMDLAVKWKYRFRSDVQQIMACLFIQCPIDASLCIADYLNNCIQVHPVVQRGFFRSPITDYTRELNSLLRAYIYAPTASNYVTDSLIFRTGNRFNDAVLGKYLAAGRVALSCMPLGSMLHVALIASVNKIGGAVSSMFQGTRTASALRASTNGETTLNDGQIVLTPDGTFTWSMQTTTAAVKSSSSSSSSSNSIESKGCAPWELAKHVVRSMATVSSLKQATYLGLDDYAVLGASRDESRLTYFVLSRLGVALMCSAGASEEDMGTFLKWAASLARLSLREAAVYYAALLKSQPIFMSLLASVLFEHMHVVQNRVREIVASGAETDIPNHTTEDVIAFCQVCMSVKNLATTRVPNATTCEAQELAMRGRAVGLQDTMIDICSGSKGRNLCTLHELFAPQVVSKLVVDPSNPSSTNSIHLFRRVVSSCGNESCRCFMEVCDDADSFWERGRVCYTCTERYLLQTHRNMYAEANEDVFSVESSTAKEDSSLRLHRGRRPNVEDKALCETLYSRALATKRIDMYWKEVPLLLYRCNPSARPVDFAFQWTLPPGLSNLASINYTSHARSFLRTMRLEVDVMELHPDSYISFLYNQPKSV